MLVTEQTDQKERRVKEKDDIAAQTVYYETSSLWYKNAFSIPELGSDSKRHLDIWRHPSLIRKTFQHLFNSMHI